MNGSTFCDERPNQTLVPLPREHPVLGQLVGHDILGEAYFRHTPCCLCILVPAAAPLCLVHVW